MAGLIKPVDQIMILASDRRSAPEASPDPMQQVQPWEKRARRWIVQNPYLSLGLAVTLGAAIGMWIKRRNP